jgi:hypothetical protein
MGLFGPEIETLESLKVQKERLNELFPLAFLKLSHKTPVIMGSLLGTKYG